MRKMNTELVFLIRDGREEHRQFRDTFKIKPRILIDDDGKVGDAYQIYQPHCQLPDSYRYYMAPAVYLIDAAGDLSCYWILSGPRGRPSPECLLGILAYAAHNDWKY
jgi:peroxiredoxin